MLRVVLLLTVLLMASVSVSAQTVSPLSNQVDATQQAAVTRNLGTTPMAFTKNLGQWPDSILFRASANGATMWFTKNGIWYQFFRRVDSIGRNPLPRSGRVTREVSTSILPDKLYRFS